MTGRVGKEGHGEGQGMDLGKDSEGREGEEKGSRSRVTGKKEPPSAKEEQSGLQTEAGGQGRAGSALIKPAKLEFSNSE